MFLPLDHVTFEHQYNGVDWQDFTSDLVSVQLNLREFAGKHTAAVTFYNALMDPAESSGTRVIKKGDAVRVHMSNASLTSRKTGTFLVTRVSTSIDLKKPPGRQYLVSVALHGKGWAGVAGTGAAKGVDTIDDLSDVVTAAPFEIGGDGFGSGRTTPVGTSTEVAYTEVASELDQILTTRDSNPGIVAFEDPDGGIQLFDSGTQRTGASPTTIDAGDYSLIDLAFDMTHIINVLTIKYLEKIKPAGKPTRTVELDTTYVDAASRGKYGPCKKTVKIHKKTDFNAYADKVFAANADPVQVPRSVVIPIRKASELRPGYEDGHYVGGKVDVVSPDGLTTWVCRVSRIQHTITSRRWLVQVFLRHPDVIRHRRVAVATEVANNPDGTILNAHVDDAAIDNRTIDDDAVDTRTIAPSSVGVTEAAGDLIGIIDDAQTAADFAQASADGKNTITYSTSNPSGVPEDGDTWFKYSAALLVGQWKGVGGAWVSLTIDSAVIANLDAGKITAGTLSGIVVQGVTLQTDSAGNRLRIRDDGTSGLIEWFTGTAGETPGQIVCNATGGHQIVLTTSHSAGGTANDTPGSMRLSSGTSTGAVGSLTLDATNLAVASIAGQGGALAVGTGTPGATGSIKCSGAINSDGSIHVTTALVGGLFDDNLAGGGSTTATFNNSGRLVRTTSSRRYKYAIRDLEVQDCRAIVHAIRARTFKRKKPDSETPADPRRYGGAIAEELAAQAAAEPFLIRDAAGLPDGIHYAELVAPIAAVVDDHDTRVVQLEAEVQRLRSMLETYVNLGGKP